MTGLDVSPNVGPQGGTNRLGVAGITFSINPRDLGRIETMFAAAPAITAKHMRDVFGQFAGSFRRSVVAGLTPNYQRLVRKSLFYRVRPKQAVQSSAAFGVGALVRSVAALEEIRMRIWATSQVTLLHETGGTITAKGKRMAIPIRNDGGEAGRHRALRAEAKRAATPAAMKAAGVKFLRRGNVLFRVDETAKGRSRQVVGGGLFKFTPTHLLTGAVHIKPALGIVRTWISLEADRTKRLQKSIDNIAREMVQVSARAVLRGALRAVS